MNAPLNKNKNKSIQNSYDRKKLLPALIAAGGACGVIAGPASALEIGDINVESALGQPLRASIAYALSPNEQVTDLCIFLRSGSSAEGLQYLSQASVTVGSSHIILRGTTPVREPMMALRVAVDCPYTPRMAREYTLLFDPVSAAAARRESVEARPEPAFRAARDSAPAAPVAANRQRRAAAAAESTPITQSTSYQVQPGDSLSVIASRIQNRNVGLWAAVDAIFAANPDAFIDDDRNKLKAGSTLVIPDLVRSAAAGTSQAAIAPARPSAAERPVTPYEGVTAQPVAEQPAETPSATEAATNAEEPAAADPAATEEVVDDTATLLSNQAETATESNQRPITDTVSAADDSSIVLPPADQSPFVTPLDESAPEVVIPDTRIENPAQTAPVVISNNEVSGEGESWNWLLWLGGSGMALILGLLFFGRRLREGFSPRPVPAFNDLDLDETPQQSVAADIANAVFAKEGDAPVVSAEEKEAAEAKKERTEYDEIETFATVDDSKADIDFNISSADYADKGQPASQVHITETGTESTILESEITPAERSGEYEVSQIVNIAESAGDETQGLPAADADSTDQTNALALTSELDIKILEQDYEEEFTATQALNAEIAKAAAELAERMEADDPAGETAVIPAINPDDTADIAITTETVSVSADDVPLDASVVTEEIARLGNTVSAEIEIPKDIEAQLEATSEELALSQSGEVEALEITSQVPAIDETSQVQAIEETSQVEAIDETSIVQAADETSRVEALDQTIEVSAADETIEAAISDETMAVQGLDETFEAKALDETAVLTITEEAMSDEETMAVQAVTGDETMAVPAMSDVETMAMPAMADEETMEVKAVDEEDEDDDLGETTQIELPSAPRDADATAELTSQLPELSDAVNDEFGEMDETAILTTHEETIEAAIGDETMEVEVESGKVDTKKIKIS